MALFLGLTSNSTAAAFEENLQKRCVNIVNYKLTDDLDSILKNYYPEKILNPKYIDFQEKRLKKFTIRNAEKGSVESITVAETIEQANPKSDSKHAGFDITAQLTVLTHVKFSKENRPSVFQCLFGRDKNTNKWFMLNAI
jgi:hypothetical protein